MRRSEVEALNAVHESLFNFLVHDVWFETALQVPAPFKFDHTWELPTLVLEKNGITYYLHGIQHGNMWRIGRGSVLRLVRELERQGRPLYSEQNFRIGYGYGYGQETQDHQAEKGLPVKFKGSLPPPLALLAGELYSLLQNTLFSLALALPPVALASIWTEPHMGGILGFIFLVLPLVGVYSNLRWNLFARYRAYKSREKFGDNVLTRWSARSLELTPMFGHAALEHYRKAVLPLPLARDSPLAWEGAPDGVKSRHRSLAMADIIRRDAVAQGHRAVHVLTGAGHTMEIAWELLNADEGQRHPR